MQNMMLQLNLPGKMIQQTQAQSSGKSGKTAKKDNDFRNLLENSSGKDASKDASLKEDDGVSKSEAEEKLDGSQTQETQGGGEKKPDGTGKKEEADTDAAQAQTLQFLMIGSVHPETLQVITGTPGAFTETQPETDGLQMLTVEALTGESQTEMISEESVFVQPELEEMLGNGQNLQTDMAQAMGETQPKAEMTQQTGKLRNGEASEAKTGREQPQPKELSGMERMVRQTIPHESQEQGKTAGEEMDHANPQTYAAQTVFQQNVLGVQVQEGAGTAPVVHVQVDSPQELMNQLLDQLKAKAAMGDQEFEIQIHPENLGRLAIKVAYTVEKVSISIVCTNERTMEMLSAGAKNIAQIMEENLGAPTTVVVDQGEDNYLEQYNNQENSRQQQEEEQQQRQEHEENNQDFLQQLRLGLV